jgi:hypothetical protein
MSAPFEGLGVFYLGKQADPDTSEITDELVLYDAADLTTHAFIVGMTGSGKTGLGLSLLEEAALDKIPVIAIDPKGDLGNLALAFPDLAPSSFRPWIDEGTATRDGITPDALAEQTAATWAKGLAEWGQDGDRIRRLLDAADVTIYTPGSDAGVPVSVLGAFDPPPADARAGEAFTERIDASVGGLLSLVGVEADPLSSPEHVFLARVLGDAWAVGRSLTLADLIGALQAPPFETIGVLSVEQFFPAKSRTGLAMRLNGLLASPGFAAWAQGAPLDADRLFYGPTGKPQLAVMSIAHLGDAERMFFVTRLLGEVLAWMRRQPGTGSLRAILYMDEIFGYLPPTANPASKALLLTLLKQARAFGLGVVLATQNPVDMDYKALANCGTWFVGRLQTERDKERLLDGLQGAAQNTGFDRAAVDRMLSGIGKRRFLLHNVHEGAPVLMATRWAMSYLAGPLTRTQIGRLTQTQRPEAPPPQAAAPAAVPVAVAESAAPPAVSLPQVFLSAAGPVERYVPMVLARIEIPYERKTLNLSHTARLTLLTEVSDGAPVWNAAERLAERPSASAAPADGAAFAPLPGPIDAAAAIRWEAELKKWAQQDCPLTVYRSAALKAVSTPEEDERAFRIRLGQMAHEARDAAKAALRTKYQARMDAIQKRVQTAQDAVDREAAQASQRKTDTLVRVGTTLLGAFLGRRGASSTLSQIGVTARSAGRMSKESSDVARAEQKVTELQAELATLDEQLRREMDALDLQVTPETTPLETETVQARQTDMHIAELALAWVPFRSVDGRMTRA